MGRVYDALRRANNVAPSTPNDDEKKVYSPDEERRRAAAARVASPELKELAELELLEKPFSFKPDNSPASESAFTAHTEERTGLALPGVMASRSAGATLDAVGSTRAALECVSIDISAVRVEPHLITITQPRTAYCEHFRALRTKVLHASERNGYQAFVVTSAGIGEGKTLTTLNLAWMLAQTDGVRALVIDSDLRRPCATEYLGIEDRNGLSEVLAGEAALEESLVRLEPAGLYLLPGGAPRDNVAELLSGPRFSRILSEVRKKFDYILIDAPPLGIFADANVLIDRADAAMLVVRSGKTRYGNVDRLLNQLPRERMLGIVVNRTDEAVVESNYYYDGKRRYSRSATGIDQKSAVVRRGA
jgi:capsular exopolysaccharide synthesis family protein